MERKVWKDTRVEDDMKARDVEIPLGHLRHPRSQLVFRGLLRSAEDENRRFFSTRATPDVENSLET